MSETFFLKILDPNWLYLLVYFSIYLTIDQGRGEFRTEMFPIKWLHKPNEFGNWIARL